MRMALLRLLQLKIESIKIQRATNLLRFIPSLLSLSDLQLKSTSWTTILIICCQGIIYEDKS